MSRVAAVGEYVRIAGYALAGVELHPAEDEQGAQRAWEELGADVGCLLLTPVAERALASRLEQRPRLIWTVIP